MAKRRKVSRRLKYGSGRSRPELSPDDFTDEGNDEGGQAGVREPRTPLPNAPGPVALEPPTD